MRMLWAKVTGAKPPIHVSGRPDQRLPNRVDPPARELRGHVREPIRLSYQIARRLNGLNERGIKTAAGKSWTPVQVTRVRERLGLTAA
jgi:hypothetical protein